MSSGNAQLTLLTSAARTATTTTDPISNGGRRGVQVLVDFTTQAAAETLTASIEGQDPASGKWFVLLTGAALSSTGLATPLLVFPGAAVSANVSANNFIPAAWRVKVTHSGSGAQTYSVGANLLP